MTTARLHRKPKGMNMEKFTFVVIAFLLVGCQQIYKSYEDYKPMQDPPQRIYSGAL